MNVYAVCNEDPLADRNTYRRPYPSVIPDVAVGTNYDLPGRIEDPAFSARDRMLSKLNSVRIP